VHAQQTNPAVFAADGTVVDDGQVDPSVYDEEDQAQVDEVEDQEDGDVSVHDDDATESDQQEEEEEEEDEVEEVDPDMKARSAIQDFETASANLGQVQNRVAEAQKARAVVAELQPEYENAKNKLEAARQHILAYKQPPVNYQQIMDAFDEVKKRRALAIQLADSFNDVPAVGPSHATHEEVVKEHHGILARMADAFKHVFHIGKPEDTVPREHIAQEINIDAVLILPIKYVTTHAYMFLSKNIGAHHRPSLVEPIVVNAKDPAAIWSNAPVRSLDLFEFTARLLTLHALIASPTADAPRFSQYGYQTTHYHVFRVNDIQRFRLRNTLALLPRAQMRQYLLLHAEAAGFKFNSDARRRFLDSKKAQSAVHIFKTATYPGPLTTNMDADESKSQNSGSKVRFSLAYAVILVAAALQIRDGDDGRLVSQLLLEALRASTHPITAIVSMTINKAEVAKALSHKDVSVTELNCGFAKKSLNDVLGVFADTFNHLSHYAAHSDHPEIIGSVSAQEADEDEEE
jgi:hypothetical protein